MCLIDTTTPDRLDRIATIDYTQFLPEGWNTGRPLDPIAVRTRLMLVSPLTICRLKSGWVEAKVLTVPDR